MVEVLSRLWAEDQGQDIAEYAVMLAVILQPAKNFNHNHPQGFPNIGFE